MPKQINLTEKYLVLNDSVQPTASFTYNFSSNAKILYEVIRVKNSIPIFIELHLDRLWKSINLLGLIAPDKDLVRMLIIELLRTNPVAENNIRISLIYSSFTCPELLIYFIPSTYPTDEQRAKGVKVKLMHAYRANPNIKVENDELRENANKIIMESDCYEVLLVNTEGFITEGSRSNVFIIKNNTIITPPLNMVLGGITRQVVMDLSKQLGFPVKEQIFNFDSLTAIDGAFLTGTSPGILPISSIDNQTYKVEVPQVLSLIRMYDDEVANDIINFKKALK